MRTYWLSHYVLTRGVLEVTGTEITLLDGTRAVDVQISATYRRTFYFGQIHGTLAEATEKAERMRTGKIQAMSRQLKKLRSLDYTKPTKSEIPHET